MRKLLTLAAGLTAAAALGLAHAGEIRAETLRIGTEGAYPPFNYIDENGELQGFDADIAKALCQAMETECEFVIQDWDGIIPGLLAERYDAIVASMSITEERKQRVDFSKKYYQTPARFVKRKDADVGITEEELDGLVVGVQRATIHENFLRDNFGELVEIQSYATQDEANLDMISGRVDLLLADSIVLEGSLLSTPEGEDFEFVGPGYTDPEWFGEGVGIALRPGEDDLRERFNAAIAQIREDGTYAEINAKYFDFDVYGE